MPMMYMPDAVKSILDIMDSDYDSLTVRTSYNLSAFSFSAGELAAAIRRHIPLFECSYKPDFRQAIADSWPSSIDDSRARHDWKWQPNYDLEAMVSDMLVHVRAKNANS